MNGFTYTNNDLAKKFGYTSDDILVGVSAQEVEKVLPEAVRLAAFDRDEKNIDGIITEISVTGQNYKTVMYERLIPLLIEAIKEQQKQIDELKLNSIK